MRIEINAGGLNSFFDGVSRFTNSGVSNSAQLIKSLQAVRNRATSLPLGTGTLGPALTFIDNRIRNEERRIASIARVMQKAAQFRETAIDTDNRVAAMVNNEWEKFYHENPWLRPAPSPGFLERIGRGIVRFLEGFTLNVFSNAQHLLDWYARNSLFLNAFGSAGLFGLPGFAAIGGDPVNMSTGNFLYNKEDIEISGRFPLVFNRFYNSKAGIERVISGSVIGYDGAVAFGSSFASPIINPITGYWRPRLSNDQAGFHNILGWRIGEDYRYSRDPLGPQRFRQGELVSNRGAPLWLSLLVLLVVYREPIVKIVQNFKGISVCE